jgi:hypothetical protein
MRNFVYRFRRSNNFRLAVFWILAVVWLLVNLLFFTGWDKPEFTQFSADQQTHYNLYFHGISQTNLERDGNFLNLLQIWMWKLWLVWLSVCIVYFPIALREEVGRAFQVARTRTRAWIDLPNEAPAQTAEGGTPTAPRHRRDQYLHQAYIFVREFASAIFAELLGERMMAR